MSSSSTDSRTLLQRLGANAQQAYLLAIAGALGAVFGLYLYVEFLQPFENFRRADSLWWARNLVAGLALGGTIGFFLNALDPLRDGAILKLARTASWGSLAGAVGGMVGLILGELVLGGLQGGLLGRAISWTILGIGIGLSQGIAYRSRQRLIYGLIGGASGGFVGGYLFEMLRQAMGGDRYNLSQGLGIVILGAGLGLFLALVEQVLRRSWVTVLNGRQEGRSYLLASQLSRIGLDEWAEVGLYGDPGIARRHAEIERRGNEYVLRNRHAEGKTWLNGQPVTNESPLNDGDRIEIGKTRLLFRRK